MTGTNWFRFEYLRAFYAFFSSTAVYKVGKNSMHAAFKKNTLVALKNKHLSFLESHFSLAVVSTFLLCITVSIIRSCSTDESNEDKLLAKSL